MGTSLCNRSALIVGIPQKLGGLLQMVVGKKYSLESSQAVVPGSELFVGMARFTFFYWVWTCPFCHVPHLRHQFSGRPPFKQYFVCVKPGVALDELRMDRAVHEILRQAFSVCPDWIGQLKQYLEAFNISGDGGVVG